MEVMLKNRKKLLAGIGLMVSCLSVVAAEKTVAQGAENSDHKAIRTAYAKSDAAANRRDVTVMMSILSPDFTAVTHQGQRFNRETYQRNVEVLFRSAESIKANNVIQKITLKGNAATVLTRNSMTLVMPTPQGGRDVIVVTERSTDSLVKRSGKWLVTHMKASSAHMTVNGKAVKV